MAEQYFVNFDYESPNQDFENCLAYYVDGTINFKVTLLTLKNRLINNIAIIDNLLEECNSIEDFNHYNSDKIEIKLRSDESKQKLLESGAISSDQQENQYYDEEETNIHRYNSINRLINRTDIGSDFEDSDTESNDYEILDDKKNLDSLISKYCDYVSDDEGNSV